jgi:hypothetical protein
VNLYGHAVVAGWVAGEPRFVLGAMLPDLAKLAGHRRLIALDPEAAAGVRWHHRTDDAFHGSVAFLRLCRDAHVELEAEGLPRGAAMAVAHVALELLLDGILLADMAGQSAYLGALASDARTLGLDDEAASVDVGAVMQRMQRYGLPLHYREPERVAQRVVSIVASRPRLAVPPERVDVVSRWAMRVRGAVEREAPGLFGELRAALLG